MAQEPHIRCISTHMHTHFQHYVSALCSMSSWVLSIWCITISIRESPPRPVFVSGFFTGRGVTKRIIWQQPDCTSVIQGSVWPEEYKESKVEWNVKIITLHRYIGLNLLTALHHHYYLINPHIISVGWAPILKMGKLRQKSSDLPEAMQWVSGRPWIRAEDLLNVSSVFLPPCHTPSGPNQHQWSQWNDSQWV